MATPYAVRRGGSLLLRTLTVGGLAAAAWFVCAGVASAGEDHSDEAVKTLDAVNAAFGGPQTAIVDQAVTEAVPEKLAPFATVTHEPQPIESAQSFESFPAVALFTADLAGTDVLAPAAPAVMTGPVEPDAYRYPDSDPYSDSTGEESYGYSGGAAGYGGYSHSGAVANTMPVPLYEAKVAAKAAARAAQAQARAAVTPTAVPLAAPVPVAAPLFTPLAPPAPAVTPATPNAEVVWEAPQPSAPAPAPKQAPAPSAPTASSGSADSGGGHRGGLLVSLTGQSDPKPLAAWSAERWDDGRTPGSVPGLPSTSPD
ncbi:hypothetical protein ACFYOT_07015 [Saccharothrix saharensis]|uniref:hypothetical protein n=1 Tax=Saccharothrix saharensis TaxID=571190 RepID=UPI00368CDFD1